VKIAGRTILTASGRYVDPLDLRPEDVCIEDIAHALSNQCRFTGHTRVFYSVAEHSVRVARAVLDTGHPWQSVAWALLHDAPEAYLVDLPRPLKHDDEIGAPFRRAEARAMATIAETFGLPGEEPAAVKHYDLTLLATERRDLMPPGGDWSVLDAYPPLRETIVPLTPAEARDEFLETFFSFRQRWVIGWAA
jgi:uncharacterized protein